MSLVLLNCARVSAPDAISTPTTGSSKDSGPVKASNVPTCKTREQDIARLYGYAQPRLEQAYPRAFSGGAPVGIGTLRSDTEEFEKKYRGFSCPGETNDHVILQMHNYMTEIEQLR